MLKIQKIDFIKALYDESLSHKIFSIANIEFTNAPPIAGALLYWKRNAHPKSLVNKQGEFKFYFDEATPEFYASVKFPAHTQLSDEQRRELAFLLLEERGTIGSYSLIGHPKEVAMQIGVRRFNIEQGFRALTFPENFNPHIEPSHVSVIFDELHLEDLHQKNPHLSKDFLRDYIPWRAKAVQQHPEEFEAYLDVIDFRYILQMNEQLSEFFLIKHIERLRGHQHLINPAVHRTLSRYFLQHFNIDHPDSFKEVAELRTAQEEEQPDATMPPYEQLISESPMHQASETYEAPPVFEHFEFDRGRFKWPGSEHLVTGIPSLSAKRYTKLGYKKLSHKEMDAYMKHFTEEQLRLVSASLELYWLSRYKKLVHWDIVCAYNVYLRADFLEAHKKFVQFDALRQNIYARLETAYLLKYFEQLQTPHQPVPLLIRCADDELMLRASNTLVVTEDVLDDIARYTSYIRMKMVLYVLNYDHYAKPLYMFYPIY